MIPPRRFSKEDRRCGEVKGRAEMRASSEETGGTFPSIDPRRIKTDAGSRGKSPRFLRMPCSGRACRLESELFDGSLGTIFYCARRSDRGLLRLPIGRGSTSPGKPFLTSAETGKITAAELTAVRRGAHSQEHPSRERGIVIVFRPGA